VTESRTLNEGTIFCINDCKTGGAKPQDITLGRRNVINRVCPTGIDIESVSPGTTPKTIFVGAWKKKIVAIIAPDLVVPPSAKQAVVTTSSIDFFADLAANNQIIFITSSKGESRNSTRHTPTVSSKFNLKVVICEIIPELVKYSAIPIAVARVDR